MRRAFDFYPTPGWATRELLKRVSIHGRVLEPCAGAGDISDELIDGCREVITNDVDRQRPTDHHGDATDHAWWKSVGSFDWTVTNPPFSDAHLILPLAAKHSTAVAMLLRMTYLEPCEGRAAWLAENPPAKVIVLPRISFTGDGKTDSVTCAWMVWAAVVRGPSIEVVSFVDERQGSLLEVPA